MDLGDSAYRRQGFWPLVPRLQPRARAYGDFGRIGSFDAIHQQQQQLFAVTDLNVSPNWEINVGVGIGPTAATDHLIVKGILGRRFSWGKHPDVQ
jgi:hypothetical protein